MLARELSDYLQSRGIGTVGTDIFIGHIGSGVQSGIYLVQSGGSGQDSYLDTFYENIDIWSVNPLQKSAYDKLQSISNILSRATNFNLTNYYVYYAQDISGVMNMDKTADELSLHKITFRVIYRNINLIS